MSDRPDARQYAPATERNRTPILEVLLQVLPPDGTVLELSSGTGEHAAYFAPQMAPRRWLPSDPNPLARESITAWRSHNPSEQLLPPLDLDARDSAWAVESPEMVDQLGLAQHPIQAIVNINMIHIAPWEACLGLLAGARRILPVQGILYLYGPFRQNGHHTAPSNAMFDENLRSQNPKWGVRHLEEVVAAAELEHLILCHVIPMPANNLSVVFRRHL